MMQRVCALLWLHLLYGAEFDQLKSSEDYDEADVQRILEEVIAYNREEYAVR